MPIAIDQITSFSKRLLQQAGVEQEIVDSWVGIALNRDAIGDLDIELEYLWQVHNRERIRCGYL